MHLCAHPRLTFWPTVSPALLASAAWLRCCHHTRLSLVGVNEAMAEARETLGDGGPVSSTKESASIILNKSSHLSLVPFLIVGPLGFNLWGGQKGVWPFAQFPWDKMATILGQHLWSWYSQNGCPRVLQCMAMSLLLTKVAAISQWWGCVCLCTGWQLKGCLGCGVQGAEKTQHKARRRTKFAGHKWEGWEAVEVCVGFC